MPGMRTPSRFHASSRPGGHARRGSALLYVIASIVLLGVVGGGVAYFSSSSNISQVSQGRAGQAYYAALSGKNLAESYSDSLTTSQLDALVAKGPVTYQLGDVNRFSLEIESPSGGSTNYSFVSTGISDATSLQGTYQVAGTNVIVPGVTPPPPEPPNLIDFNFIASKEGFAAYSADQTRDYAAGKDNADIRPGNLTLGASMTYGFGNIWFSGRVSGLAQNGVMSFGNGFSVFFSFKFANKVGDGFSFAVINGTGNNYGSCGGDSAMGELLGYAGDSRVYEGNGTWDSSSGKILKYMDSSGLSTPGLHPPKFSVEVDTYANNSSDFDRTLQCTARWDGTREDYNGSHVAIMLWGDDTKGYPAKICPNKTTNFKGNVYTYDDNVHGIGGNAADYSYAQLKAMTFSLDKEYYYRMDVTRATNYNETGSYTVTAWIYSCSKNSCKNTIFGGDNSLSDTQHYWTEKSIGNSSNVKVTKTFTLTKDQHTAFSKFLFGITSASGSESQQIDIRNIGISLY